MDNTIKTQSKIRTILHMDGDAFFVGVEISKNPKLRGLPVVTGEERGIVSALSYEAKAIGIIRGMPIFKVKKDFPNVIILSGDYASYARYSKMMFDIVRRYADDVEEYSIDECFADLTGLDLTLKLSYREIAERIKKEINEELDLSISIGISSTKVLAKVASKWKKPNGLTIIDNISIVDFLKEIQIQKIWGIGARTSELLIRKGIRTALDFSSRDIQWIRSNLSKPYEMIWYELHGKMIIPIDGKAKDSYSSIQKTRSFYPSNNDKVFLLSQLSKHIEDACSKARHYSLITNRISFFLKSKDFEYFTLNINIPNPTNAPESIISIIKSNFHKIYNENIQYRTTGIVLLNLYSNISNQGNLFEKNNEMDRFELIHKQIDKLEDKYGKRIVYLASTHNAIKYRKNNILGTDSEDLDRDLLFL